MWICQDFGAWNYIYLKYNYFVKTKQSSISGKKHVFIFRHIWHRECILSPDIKSDSNSYHLLSG